MSEDDQDDSAPMVSADPEINELLGLFDLPAFARRGQDLEYALARIHTHCRTHREDLIEMVRMRLRQWSRAAAGPEGWRGVFTESIEPLWTLAQAPEPAWTAGPVPARQRMAVARDLIASVTRFNQRWRHFLDKLNLGPTNLLIDQYNCYYVIEKECVLGSARLAARYFTPVRKVSPETLLCDYPTLPVPELVNGNG